MNDQPKTHAQLLDELQTLRQELASEKQRAEHLRTARELSPDAFTILRSVRDATGQIVDFEWEYANPAAATLLRRPQEELIGHRLLRVLPGNQSNRDLFVEYVRVAETGETMDRELHYQADGIDGWFWNKTVKIGDGVANFVSNVTVRKQLEEMARQEKEAAESTLRVIVRATSPKTGLDYCQSLVRFLGEEIGIRYAFIGKLDGPNKDRIQTITFWKGDGLAENFQYDLDGTPCETVIGKQLRHYPRDVAELFPGDDDLKTLHVQCYLGVPLFDKVGEPLGILVVMDDKEQGTDPLNEPTLLQTVASRVAAELERLRAEEALRISDERWQLALRGSNAGVWDWNPKTNEVFFSTRWKTMLGFSEEEIGTSLREWSDRVHPDDLLRVMQALEDHFVKKTEFYKSEYRVRCKDGSYKWILDRGQALWDSEGSVVRAVGSHTDITMQKQIEAALQASEERFRSFMDNNPAVAYIKDEAGHYLYVNKPLEDYLLGESDSTRWLEKTDYDLWPQQAAQLRMHDKVVLAKNATVTVEETTSMHDGIHHWLSLKFPLTGSDRQRLIGGVSIDITERKRAEDWLNSLIETTQDAVISIDRQGRIMRFNSAAEHMFGYSKAEILGQKVNLLMPKSYADEHDSYISRYEETRVPHAIGRIRTVTAQRKTGEPFPIELSVTEIPTDNDIRYGAFIRDISEKVRLQEQLVDKERLAAIGETAAKFAHEIGNPLNGMYARLQLLDRRLQRQREVLDEKVASDMQGIIGEVQRLSNLLQEFRSLSRQQHFNRQPTDITTIASAVLEAEAANFQLRGIRVEHLSMADLPELLIDSSKFTQVVVNLCKNAVEAMPNGGTLTIREFNSGGKVTIEVTDTGAGIATGVNIFEPFITTKPEGTGLGLPIVRQIIAGHGGTLTYTSEVGKGTTFRVLLPVPSTGEKR